MPKRGGRRRARYVTPDLSYYWVGAQGEWREENKWDEKKNDAELYYYYQYHTQHPYPFPFLFLCVSILLSRQIILTGYSFLVQ